MLHQLEQYTRPPQNSKWWSELLVYLDDDPLLLLGRAYCDATENGCVGSGIYFDYEEGPTTLNRILAAPVPGNSDFLRITRSGAVYTGFHSTDGSMWKEVGSFTTSTLGGSGVRIGLAAYRDTGAVSATARFASFTLTSHGQD